MIMLNFSLFFFGFNFILLIAKKTDSKLTLHHTGLFFLRVKGPICRFRCAQAQYCTEKVCASLSRLILHCCVLHGQHEVNDVRG